MVDLGARRRCVFGVIVAVLTSAAHGQAQPPSYRSTPARYEVVVEKNVTITTRDGTRLAADLYRPTAGGRPLDGRLPTLLTRTP
jgi:predicted acyl esterase